MLCPCLSSLSELSQSAAIHTVKAFDVINKAEVLVRTVTALYFMFRLNWLLAIIPSLGMLFAAFIAIKMENKLDDVYGEIEEENSKLNNTAQENLAGVRTVKAFSREPFEILKFKKHNERYYQLNIEQSKVFVKYHPFIQEFEDATLVLLKRGRDHKSRNAGSLKDRTNTQSIIY